jgi:FlaA1/EpsC-like NDP-sugar epimerase
MTPKVNSVITLCSKHFRNRYIFALDVFFVAISVVISFGLRLELLLPPDLSTAIAAYLVLAVLVRMATMTALGIYTRYWPYANVDDLLHLTFAISVSTLILSVLAFGVLMPTGVWDGSPRSVLIIDWFVCLLLVGGGRFFLYELVALSYRAKGAHSGERVRALIAGAGNAGMLVAREVIKNPAMGLAIVGFVDDDPAKQRIQVNALPVLGTSDDLPWLILKHKVGQVIITMPSAPGSTIRRIREQCKQVEIGRAHV